MPHKTEDQEDIEVKRKDDSFFRKVGVGLTAGLLLQAGVTIFSYGILSNQVANNTKAITAFAAKNEQQNQINISLGKLEVLLNTMNIQMQAFSTKLDYVAGEQQRRSPIIENMSEYMRRNGK